MSPLCTWCETEFEPQVIGLSVKRFCSTDCRQDFHAACRIWGEEAHGAGEVTTFQLRTSLARRARRTERNLAAGGPQVPKTETRTDEPLRTDMRVIA